MKECFLPPHQNNFQQRHTLAFLTSTFEPEIKIQKSMEPNTINLTQLPTTAVELEKTSSKNEFGTSVC